MLASMWSGWRLKKVAGNSPNKDGERVVEVASEAENFRGDFMNASKGHTADVIVAVARQIFFEKGYEKATTREISERAGISKAALYHHFKGKEEILFQIVNRASDELIANMKKALSQPVAKTGGGERDHRCRQPGICGSFFQ